MAELMDQEYIANYSPDPNEWLQQVLSGGFLGSNPYIDELIGQIEADAQRNFSQSILPTATARLNQSGAYGTALGSMARAGAADNFSRGLMGQLAGIRYQDYGSERDRMMQALGIYSGQEDNARNLLGSMRMNTEDAMAAIRQARISANASMYGADRGLDSARLAANASRYGSSQAAGASRYGSSLAHQRGMLALQQGAFNDLMGYSSMFNNYNQYGNPWSAPAPSQSTPIGPAKFFNNDHFIGGPGADSWGSF